MILTVDLGTTVTKAIVWGPDGPLAEGRAEVALTTGPGGRVEQDADDWWRSVVAACAGARSAGGGAWRVEAVSFTGARQTFVPVDAEGRPLGPALVWSDRRAGVEAAALARQGGGVEAVRLRTGGVLHAGSVAAKLAWLARHEPERLTAARWVLGPRELVVRRLTGAVASDVTTASATGMYGSDGTLAVGGLGPSPAPLATALPLEPAGLAELMPPVVEPSSVVGETLPRPAAELGLPAGAPVVLGAGDRACEALGVGASPRRPFVAWGTTANASVPVEAWPDPVPACLQVTAGAVKGWLLEGGLAAAGDALRWLGALTGTGPDDLMAAAAGVAPGAAGAVALPWLGGARAPWWRDDVGAASLNLSAGHGPAELARAVVEGVAWDVLRCLEAVAAAGDAEPEAVLVAGGGRQAAWMEILTGVTGLPAQRRRTDRSASVGAALLAGVALDLAIERDRIDPVVDEVAPDPEVVKRYQELRPMADAFAEALVHAAPEASDVPGAGAGG